MVTPLLALLLVLPGVLTQISDPIVTDAQVNVAGNKFLQRTATKDVEVRSIDEVVESTCSHDIAIKWHAKVGSAVYATPVITDLYSDGRKDIIVPTFVHSLEVVEGRGGAKAVDFEAFHESTLHTSPLLFDIDYDGVQDIVIATSDGDILFFKDNGDVAAPRLTVPTLELRRTWYEGLAADHVDHSHPDVHGRIDEQSPALQDPVVTTTRRRLMAVDDAGDLGAAEHGADLAAGGNADTLAVDGNDGTTTLAQEQQGTNVIESPPAVHRDAAADGDAGAALTTEEASLAAAAGAATDGTAQQADTPPSPLAVQGATAQKEGAISEEAATSYVELFGVATEEDTSHEGLEADGPLSPRSLRAMNEGNVGRQERRPGDVGGDDKVFKVTTPEDDLWGDEDWHAPDHYIPIGSVNIRVDAHILATPAIADIDGDGREEMVVVVSYYFDKDYYSNALHLAKLGKDVDISKYLAVGVVVYDLGRRAIKWSQHMDLTTEQTSFKALGLSPPTLVDVNGDGELEIVFGTSVGFLYVLHATTGEVLEGWPIQMGSIQGAVVAGDINGDGRLELVATDTRGNVAVFGVDGKEVWERHLESGISQGVTLGDVNGDGVLEVVVGTTSGAVHVLLGTTGADLAPFPFQAGARITAPILLTPLGRSPSARTLHLVFLAHDGFLYTVDGSSGCVEGLDLGEVGYAQALADDLDGNGRMDLLVATMGGDLYCVETAAPYHPLRAWTSAAQGLNSYTARWNWEGVWASADTRAPRDVRGRTLPVRFAVVDVSAGAASAAPYRVSVTLQNVALRALGGEDTPIIGLADQLNATGRYTLEVPCPITRTTATVRVEMRDRFGLVSRDEFSLSFHMHFYKLLKWLVTLPLAFTLAAVALMRHDLALPL